MKVKDIDLAQKKHLSILIYGPAGSGKTDLVAQASGGYLFDFDDGMRSARILQDKFTPLRAEIEFDTYMDVDPVNPTAWMRANKKIIQLSDASAKGTLIYNAVIIDSLTGMARAIHLQTMLEAGGALKKAQIQHWGSMVDSMEIALTRLRGLNTLVIVTAHELNMEIDGDNKIRPMSVTKRHSLEKLAWLFDEVLYSSARPAGMNKVNYIVSGRPTSSIMARTRSGFNEAVVHNDIGLVGILAKIGYTYRSSKDGKD